MTSPFLSIIIPAHNEEHRLPHTLEQVFAFLTRQTYPSEVLVVENGSRDGTLAVAQRFARRHKGLRVFHEEKAGKGLAVRRGILEARGEYRFLCDADLSMPIEELPRFLPPALPEAEIVIASREAPGAVRYNEPFHRHLTGRVFNLIIRLLVLPGLQDTQCGFKCFRADVAEDIFPRQTLTGWAFDVEVLAIARLRGYRIVELPIPWYFNAESKVSVVRDSWRMFLDLLRIRRNIRQGIYDETP
ncbi:MAG: glycosyltransferase family 2 protein [Anaerolineae bacterium]|nr:MAG: glycosyltransferase family 2 protein [Anaerolineae bacterium]